MKHAFLLLEVPAGALLLGALLLGMIGAAHGETPRERPEIIAHRGASWDAPENTPIAYKLAWEWGSDAVETDVYLTADDQVVCIHDGSLKRTTGLDKRVEEATWEEISGLDAGSWKGEEFAGERIPLLAELIEMTPPGKRFFIDVKSNYRIVPFLEQIIEESGKRDQMVIIGFNKHTMMAAVDQIPGVPVYWLLCGERDEETRQHLPLVVERVAETKEAGFDALNICYHSVTDEVIEAAREAGVGVKAWTVNDMDLAKRLWKMGVTGITTDRPREMLAMFDDLLAEKTEEPTTRPTETE